MKTLALAASLVLVASTFVPACSGDSSSSGDAADGGGADATSADGPFADTAAADAGRSACAAAGGACVLGSAACASVAPDGAQDCNPNPPNPGGAFCCLALADAAPPPADGGTTCVAAGGQCVALTPTSCAGGTVLDATKYPCGTGLGVECCLPAPVDGGHPGPFACGQALVCDGRTQICHIYEGGAVRPDGGVRIEYACEPIPASCAQPMDVTCTCIKEATSTQLCSSSNGDVTVTTLAP